MNAQTLNGEADLRNLTGHGAAAATPAVKEQIAVMGKGRMRRAVEIMTGLVVAPVLGLAFVVFLPVVGIAALAWMVVEELRVNLQPATAA